MEHRVSTSQLDELLDFLLENPAIANASNLGPRAKELSDRQWDALASRLNAHEAGSTKDGIRWKRYWADLKHKVKVRAASACSGGGGLNARELSDNDKKILTIIGDKTEFDHSQFRVSAVYSRPAVSSVPLEHVYIQSTSPTLTEEEFEEVEFLADSPPMATKFVHTPDPPSLKGQAGFKNPTTRMRPRRVIAPREVRRPNTNWVKDLEYQRLRVSQRMADAQNKLAEANMITARALAKLSDVAEKLCQMITK